MKRILVVYATRFGSTAEVAKYIGTIINHQGIAVDVRLVNEISSLHGYDAVVLGSAIRSGKWMPEAFHFLTAHRAELRHMPVAYFTVCATLHDDTPENRAIVSGYHTPLLETFRDIQPVSIGMFAGKIDFKKIPLMLRVVAKTHHLPDGDWRSWEQIEVWAREVPLLLANAQPI